MIASRSPFIISNILVLIFLTVLYNISVIAQHNPERIWHGKERYLRYKPDGDDFVIKNGTRRFNRALYGTNTAFRVEAGDLPEFALYLPGMGGNLRFGLITDNESKWLIKAENIVARYRPGSMLYEITDPLLGKGKLFLTVLAMADTEGMIIRTFSMGITGKVELFWSFGGATGTKFSRDGDLNLDPESSFYLKPENCKTSSFDIIDNNFTLYFGKGEASPEGDTKDQNKGRGKKRLSGVFPDGSNLKITDAGTQESPVTCWESTNTSTPVLVGKIAVKEKEELFFMIENSPEKEKLTYSEASAIFKNAESKRKELSGRIKIETPDPLINTLGGTIAVAGDAIWEHPTYLHGAIGWRMRLNGWRGPYTGDPLGWHDRSRTHFDAYAESQLTSPESGPNVPDPQKNLARQQEKIGNSLFTSGYICRNPNGRLTPHHYDMNLVFIDALLRHFMWTGDTGYVRKMWPVLKRHLAWEKRNFDGNNDGLYDAYCCIWASDALQYSGGGVTHSSAYNYFANRTAAYLANRIGENPEPYEKEAQKILKAMNSELWLSSKGWFAEYKDLSGLQLVHPEAALWTVYHTIDSEVPNQFQAYQMTRYVDNNIPHIPVLARGLPDQGYYVLSTSSWMPYDWSINNVVMAENIHMALAYWQSGRREEAFKLWKSSILDAMYLGSSPGNFVQLSFYDAARGEAYRDFADEVGMTARAMVEGLFGIQPNALEGILTIRPGLPADWDHASLRTPDLSFAFKRTDNKEVYTIHQLFPKAMKVKFNVKALKESVRSVTLNGKDISWKCNENAIETPEIEINSLVATDSCTLIIEWQGEKPEKTKIEQHYALSDSINLKFNKLQLLDVIDPQKVFKNYNVAANYLNANITSETGSYTLFIKVKQEQLSWYLPVCLEIKKDIEILAPKDQKKNVLTFSVKNNTNKVFSGKLRVNSGLNAYISTVSIKKAGISHFSVPQGQILCGSNLIHIDWNDGTSSEEMVTNWEVDNSQPVKFEKINMVPFYNDKVTSIFAPDKYLSPRSPYPTLALPTQGIGNWCYPLIMFNVNDSGLRKLAGNKNEIIIPQGVPFSTPGRFDEKNIVFTSRWDNYPSKVNIPLSGKATHAYFLMAGSTNPMQSRIINGEVIIEYTDGTTSKLELTNPDTWWPIEQDYYTDDFAFYLTKPKPVRVHLKTGIITRSFSQYTSLKGYSNYVIDGGAATVLDIPLNSAKELKSMSLETKCNDVVIGLMSCTLVREN